MPRYNLSLIEKSQIEIFCVCYASQIAPFVKSVPSDVINRSKSIDYSTHLFRLVIYSEARTRFDDITKNQPLNTRISWFNAQMLSFSLS